MGQANGHRREPERLRSIMRPAVEPKAGPAIGIRYHLDLPRSDAPQPGAERLGRRLLGCEPRRQPLQAASAVGALLVGVDGAEKLIASRCQDPAELLQLDLVHAGMDLLPEHQVVHPLHEEAVAIGHDVSFFARRHSSNRSVTAPRAKPAPALVAVAEAETHSSSPIAHPDCWATNRSSRPR